MTEAMAGMAALAHSSRCAPERHTSPRRLIGLSGGRWRVVLARVAACGRHKRVQFPWLEAGQVQIEAQALEIGEFEAQQLVVPGAVAAEPVVADAVRLARGGAAGDDGAWCDRGVDRGKYRVSEEGPALGGCGASSSRSSREVSKLARVSSQGHEKQ